MSRSSLPRLVAAITVLALLAAPALAVSSHAEAGTSDQLYSEIESSFKKVSDIQREGGNVTGVVQLLNQALVLVGDGMASQANDPSQAQAYYQQAESTIGFANQELPTIEQQGISASQSEVIWFAVTLSVLTAAGIVVLVFGRRVFWTLWIRAHRKWTVSKA